MREEITSSSVSTRRGGRLRPGRVLLLAGLAGLAGLAPGCGDGPICASDIAVFITAPDEGSMFWDGDDIVPGVQTDVVVRTNLHQSELVELRVIDQFGVPQLYTTLVDGEGTAFFELLPFPDGPVTLEATAITEQCGSGQDAIEIDVFGTTGCELQIREQPVPSELYAPLPVLNATSDSNFAFEGFQANVDIWAQPDAYVELMIIDLETGLPTSAGLRTADGSGWAGYGLTVPEGAQALEARCVSPEGSVDRVSNRLSVYVDTVAPTCRLVSPELGVDLSPALDVDGDPTNGTQIELTGEVIDDDQSGAAPLVPLFVVNFVAFEGSEVGEDGMSKVTVELESEGSYLLGVQAQDRAGNICLETSSFDYSVTGVQMQATSRHSARLSWVSPDISGLGTPPISYTVRVAEEPIDEFNFDEVGQVVEDAPEPGLPGTPESMLLDALTPGRTYYAAVMAESDFGRKLIGAAGPAALAFDVTDAIGPVTPNEGDNGLGYQVAAGDFNADSFSDLAMSAPFKAVNGQAGAGAVYVYFGGPEGLGTTPDMTIEGSAAGEQLGSGLTTIRWNNDDVDDLAVGVPFAAGGNGQVQVFLGVSDFAASGPPDATIEASGAAGNWLASSGLGFALTRARFDGDGRDDLVISAPGGGDGHGGVVVLYGGANLSNIVLSSQSTAGSGDAVALVLQDPDPDPRSIFDEPPAAFFGQYVFPLGRTQGVNDADDDIGVAYTEKNSAVVFRGRAKPASPGVTLATFDPALDLEMQRTTTTDPSARFGTAMGSIADLDGDGAREIVVGMWRDGNNVGRVEIYRGNAMGVKNTSTDNIRLRSITPGANLCSQGQPCGLGSAIVNNAAGLIKPDVNGDGLEDLIVVGGMGAGRIKMLVWFGGSIPTAPDISSDSAQYVIEAPAFEAGAIGDSDATSITALWGGDVNGDGLEDICWADWSSTGRDGAFVVLYDDGQ